MQSSLSSTMLTLEPMRGGSGHAPLDREESVHTPPSKAGVGDMPPTASSFQYDDTTIIFDWDDTLLSSSWLVQNALRLDEPAVLPPEALVQLDMLSSSVLALVKRAQTYGRCVIITNAETGWVELSAKRFLPRVVPMLAKLRVLSARSTFEALYPDSPSDWKVQAFHQELCATYMGRRPDAKRNVISFGDSVHERVAIHRVTSGLGPSCRTKSIKFVERPTVEQLWRQVDLVSNCLDEIVGHNGPLDLMLTVSVLYPGSSAASK